MKKSKPVRPNPNVARVAAILRSSNYSGAEIARRSRRHPQTILRLMNEKTGDPRDSTITSALQSVGANRGTNVNGVWRLDPLYSRVAALRSGVQRLTSKRRPSR